MSAGKTIGVAVIAGIGLLLLWFALGERGSTSSRATLPETAGPQRGAPLPVVPSTAVDPASEVPAREKVASDVAAMEDEAKAGAEGEEEWPGPCSVHGTLLDPSERPVERRIQWVIFHNEKGEKHHAEEQGARYRVKGLAPGHWWVTASVLGFEEGRAELDLFEEDEARRLDLTLTPGQSLDVLLFTPGGRSFFEASEDTDLRAGNRAFLAVESAEDLGPRHTPVFEYWTRFSWRDWEDDPDASKPLLGTLRLEGGLPAHVSLLLGDLVLATDVVPVGSEEVRFVLDPGHVQTLTATLRFKVLDRAGAPLREAFVFLETMLNSQITQEIGEDGSVEYSGLTPGEYDLVIGDREHKLKRHTLALDPGLNDLGDLVLERAEGIRGLIVDLNGEPVTREEGTFGVSIRFGRIDPDTGELHENDSFRIGTDEDGSFFLDFEPGRYLLQAWGQDWMSLNTIVDLENPPPEIRLTVFPPSTLVLMLETGSWDGFRYRVVDETGYQLAAGALAGTAPVNHRLAPGPYTLFLMNAEGAVVMEQLFTLRNETLTINVLL